jgi:adenine-specific DNA-methyltransferase
MTVVNALGPIQRRLLAEDLVRLRRPDEQRRYAACQRQGRIDPNPHQIDGVVFALRRIPEGGCILADEVGLGKTIEAGLIMSQLIAEGMRRVLLIVPKSLLGQWQTELYTLFGIEAREGRLDPEAFSGTGVFLTHRELAGGPKGASLLKATDPFDLVVVDEAHEVFSALYKRYNKEGVYDEESTKAQTAGRVREVVKRGGSPVLLLTATPIQNSLAELWGLVQYVEPTGMLLGRLPTFREVFCDAGDRSVLPDQAPELKRRLQTVMQRTLRRQAQEFLEVPFVERHLRVFEYSMSQEEKALYVDVTAWLMRENLHAFRGNQRHLLLIGFHRRMASSLEALAVSLRRVAQRLRDRLANRGYTVSDDGKQLLRDFADDLEGNLEPESREDISDSAQLQPAEGSEPVSPVDEGLHAELQAVEEFAVRASALNHDSKAQCLLDALRIVRERGERGDGTGKAVIFTESLTTQNYLRKLLLEYGHDADDVTLFCGDNETPDAERALDRWENEVGRAIPTVHRPSREVALRLALVYEFAQRSRVFISTEAGAKGLNLQFCDTIINYDLPWNPQRIEQRIGRVHRYGQKRGVTVVSFLAAGNDAQKLTLEIITQKLDLFGKVLDASDAVLYEPSHDTPESLVASVSVDFEKELWSIYSRARSVDDVTADLRHLRSTMEQRRREFDEEQERASGLVESRLDDAVRKVFAKYQSDLPTELEGLDRDVDAITCAFFQGAGVPHSRTQVAGRVEYEIQPSVLMPQGYQGGLFAIIGDSRDIREGEVLHVGHPVVQAAIEDARRATSGPIRVVLESINETPKGLRPLVGRRGRLVVTKASYRGIEPVDNLLTTAVMEGGDDPLSLPLVDAVVKLPVRSSDSSLELEREQQLQDAIDEAVVADQALVSSLEQARFQQMLRQLEHYLADQVLLMRRKRSVLDTRIEELEKKRDKSLSPHAGQETARQVEKLSKDAREIDRQIERLEEGGDEEYRVWRERLFARRFQKPEIARILDVQFEIAGSGSEC